jgi:hypothetical protein
VFNESVCQLAALGFEKALHDGGLRLEKRLAALVFLTQFIAGITWR